MINLLPPQYKIEFRQEENFRLILTLGILILFFLVSLILILISVKIYLWEQVETTKILVNLEEKYFQTPETKVLQEKIRLANQNLSKLNSFYQGRTDSTEILEKISETLPSGIYLTNFSWQKSTSQIAISGFCPNQKTLFEFKKNLEKQKEFSEVYFPLSNWIKSKDIDFDATFKVIPK